MLTAYALPQGATDFNTYLARMLGGNRKPADGLALLMTPF